MNRSETESRRRRKIIRRERRKAAALKATRVTAQSKEPVLSSSRCKFGLSSNNRVIPTGGLGLVTELVKELDMATPLNRLGLLERNLPYHESDHILTLVYNVICGGRCLADTELLRSNHTYLRALQAKRLPGSSTLGDFLRRFDEATVDKLMNATHQSRVKVWQQQPPEFFEEATIDGDSTVVPVDASCKEGIGTSYLGVIGYHPLVLSLAQTNEPLFIVNRPGNANSPRGATHWFDESIRICRSAGFRKITLRGDTAFSQTKELDRWTAEGIRCVFGIKLYASTLEKAVSLPQKAWKRLCRPSKYEVKTVARGRRRDHREELINERGYKNQKLRAEWVAESTHRFFGCSQDYRVIFLKKDIDRCEGQLPLLQEDKYFGLVTNDFESPAEEIVSQACKRANQENLIEQLKNEVGAFRNPVNTLEGNWAYSVIAALAWSLKTWISLLIPVGGRWKKRHKEEKADALRMEFKRFLTSFVNIPAQVIRAGRKIELRFVGWSPHLPTVFRTLQRISLCFRH